MRRMKLQLLKPYRRWSAEDIVEVIYTVGAILVRSGRAIQIVEDVPTQKESRRICDGRAIWVNPPEHITEETDGSNTVLEVEKPKRKPRAKKAAESKPKRAASNGVSRSSRTSK